MRGKSATVSRWNTPPAAAREPVPCSEQSSASGDVDWRHHRSAPESQILNTRHETPQFEPARIREATKRNEFFTLRCARGKEGGPVTCSMQMLAPTMRTVELASPTAKDYTRTRVSSAAVQDWLARHRHKKPLYMVTGIKTVTDARFVHRYPRGVKKWYTWQGLRERRLRPQQPPDLVATTMTGEHPFSVRITKMEYKKTGKDRWADYEWVYEPFTEGALAH
ncbi:hypothetical protein MY5147_005846 [Beauveria neobassiana]